MDLWIVELQYLQGYLRILSSIQKCNQNIRSLGVEKAVQVHLNNSYHHYDFDHILAYKYANF